MDFISKKEFSAVLITLMTVKLLLGYPLGFVRTSGSAAWMQMVFATVLCLLIFWLTTLLYPRRLNIIEIADIYGGRAARVAVGLVSFAVLMLNMVSVMRIFPESVKIILLPDIETDIIIGVCTLTMFIGALFGIDSAARINYIVLPVCGILFAAFAVMLFPFYKTENLTPFFGRGAAGIFLGGAGGLPMFSDLIVLNILLARTKNIREARGCGFRAILISGAAGTLTLLVYGLIYPYPVSENFILPVYQITRMIDLSSFFNRFEAVFQFAWSVLVFLYGSIYIYVMCFVWQTAFRLKYIKPLVLPVTLLVSGTALLPRSIMDADVMGRALSLAAFPAALFLPIILGAADTVKIRRAEKRAEVNDDENR